MKDFVAEPKEDNTTSAIHAIDVGEASLTDPVDLSLCWQNGTSQHIDWCLFPDEDLPTTGTYIYEDPAVDETTGADVDHQSFDIPQSPIFNINVEEYLAGGLMLYDAETYEDAISIGTFNTFFEIPRYPTPPILERLPTPDLPEIEEIEFFPGLYPDGEDFSVDDEIRRLVQELEESSRVPEET